MLFSRLILRRVLSPAAKNLMNNVAARRSVATPAAAAAIGVRPPVKEVGFLCTTTNRKSNRNRSIFTMP